MPRYLPSAGLLFYCFAALAQPVSQSGLAAERQIEREQLRAELRMVLKPVRPGDAATGAGASAAVGKHLSPREHAELREQLRQQSENPRPRP